MSERQPRWEIVHTAVGWHARFRSSNGNVIVSTETYQRRAKAVRAIELVLAPTYGWIEDGHVVCLATRDSWNKRNRPGIEVREVDEIPAIPRDLDDAKALGQWAAAQPKVKAEIKADKKIHAIKELRGLTGASLLQAKNAIEQIPRWKR